MATSRGADVANTTVGYWNHGGATVWGVQWSRKYPFAHEFFIMQPTAYTAFVSSTATEPVGYAAWLGLTAQDPQGADILQAIEQLRLVAPAFDSSI